MLRACDPGMTGAGQVSIGTGNAVFLGAPSRLFHTSLGMRSPAELRKVFKNWVMLKLYCEEWGQVCQTG